MSLVIACSISLFSASAMAAIEPTGDPHKKDHEQLTALRKTAEEAINSKNFDLLKPSLVPGDFTVITVDGQKLQSLDAFAAYWKSLFNDRGLDKIVVHPVADGPTEFLADNVGVCHGTSNDEYYFKSGDVRAMPERWTAIMLKQGPDWKISRIVFSANILDNPVLGVLAQKLQIGIAIAAVLGFVLGALSGWLMARSGTKKA